MAKNKRVTVHKVNGVLRFHQSPGCKNKLTLLQNVRCSHRSWLQGNIRILNVNKRLSKISIMKNLFNKYCIIPEPYQDLEEPKSYLWNNCWRILEDTRRFLNCEIIEHLTRLEHQLYRFLPSPLSPMMYVCLGGL